MLASDCLKHAWLKRKETNAPKPPMEVTKDNLRQFVERWNEHPNSPYIFQVDTPIYRNEGRQKTDSLSGGSPSPCESLSSLPDADNRYLNYTSNNYELPSLRRASDSTGIVKTNDVVERINLAEEIRKLSDKLYQLSNMPTNMTNNKSPFDEHDRSEESKESYEMYNSARPQSPPLNGNQDLPKDHPSSPNCTIPWRRTKYKLNHMSRDVPLIDGHMITKMTAKRADSLNNHVAYSASFSSKSNNINGTKDLLLKLLERWERPKMPARPTPRHSSISSEWGESDHLAQRSISSLNTFFQLRTANKKVTPFHQQH